MSAETAMATLLDTSGVARASRYSAKDVSKILGLTRARLRQLESAGELTCVHTGPRSTIYTHRDLVAYLAKHNGGQP